jgi:hypothetical protein
MIGSGLFTLSLAYQARDRLRAYFLPSPGSRDYTGLRAGKVPRQVVLTMNALGYIGIVYSLAMNRNASGAHIMSGTNEVSCTQ